MRERERNMSVETEHCTIKVLCDVYFVHFEIRISGSANNTNSCIVYTSIYFQKQWHPPLLDSIQQTTEQ